MNQSSGFVLIRDTTLSPSFHCPRLRNSSTRSKRLRTFLFFVSPPGGLKLGCLLISVLYSYVGEMTRNLYESYAGAPAGSTPGSRSFSLDSFLLDSSEVSFCASPFSTSFELTIGEIILPCSKIS